SECFGDLECDGRAGLSDVRRSELHHFCVRVASRLESDRRVHLVGFGLNSRGLGGGARGVGSDLVLWRPHTLLPRRGNGELCGCELGCTLLEGRHCAPPARSSARRSGAGMRRTVETGFRTPNRCSLPTISHPSVVFVPRAITSSSFRWA